jgi:hypothetical protein
LNSLSILEAGDLCLSPDHHGWNGIVETYGFRGYSTTQLAADCTVNILSISSGLAPIVFISADNELNVAASNEGLIVENPNT